MYYYMYSLLTRYIDSMSVIFYFYYLYFWPPVLSNKWWCWYRHKNVNKSTGNLWH